MTYPIAATREFTAPPEKVWALVSDLPRMGEWSPENAGGSWAKGATGPAVGAVFSGKNHNGLRRWSTTATVVACEPGRVFEIAITFLGLKVANWRYEFEPTAGGCTVTESWRDNRTGWQRVAGRPMGDHSGDHARAEMEATLANLAKAVEG
jgi:uncharacterized protein YndB with AHSA1/START domain